jgi:hypothetical protein
MRNCGNRQSWVQKKRARTKKIKIGWPYIENITTQVFVGSTRGSREMEDLKIYQEKNWR